jgi:hypothetical protein
MDWIRFWKLRSDLYWLFVPVSICMLNKFQNRFFNIKKFFFFHKACHRTRAYINRCIYFPKQCFPLKEIPKYKIIGLFLDNIWIVSNLVYLETGGPDWAIFFSLGDCLLWAFLKNNIHSSANFWATFFIEKVCIIYIFGRFLKCFFPQKHLVTLSGSKLPWLLWIWKKWDHNFFVATKKPRIN